MLIRVTQTVQDKGRLVAPEELDAIVSSDRKVDWYYSPFLYGDDAKQYVEANNGSISGYSGETWTDTLYWDLDSEDDLDKVIKATVSLLDKLFDIGEGFGDAVEVYFSGNKGVHILLRTKNKFKPTEVSRICYNIAKEADILSVFDTVVYNPTRIFRVANTRHKKSGLYKIQLRLSEIADASFDVAAIKELAKKPRFNVEETAKPVEAALLLERYKEKSSKTNVVDLKKFEGGGTVESTADVVVPEGMRRCNYLLELGHFGKGERSNALIRIASYCKLKKGLDKDQTRQILYLAMERRAALGLGSETWDEKEIESTVLNQVFSDRWRDGYFTCTGEKADVFLQGICDKGPGCCMIKPKPQVMTMGIEALIEQYKKYASESPEIYPKFGIDWLDKYIRLRPRNFSMINGANGSGKTSLATQLIDNLNRQQLYHFFFSADMADSSLFEKLGAKYTQYDQAQIESAFQRVIKDQKPSQKDQDIVSEVITKLKATLPYTIFDFSSSIQSDYIEKTIRETEAAKSIKVRLAIIDYAGRMKSEHDNAYMNATQNATDANTIAKRCDCHLVYISQIAREQGDHIKPLRTSRVSKDSGAWEENATAVLNVWRPMGFDPAIDRYIHLFIGKNRGPGVSAEHVMWWDGKEGSFRELNDDEYEHYVELCQQNYERRGTEAPHRDGYDNRSGDQIRASNSAFDRRGQRDDNDESDEEYERRTRGEGYSEERVQKGLRASEGRKQFKQDA
jgi:KaiC/GvpD/RAD55 family RecA-like ATPase